LKTPKHKKNEESPLYIQIGRELEEKIKSSCLEKISETILMKEYGISRNTAFRTLNLLQEKGWVKRINGKGTFPVPGNKKNFVTINLLLENSFFMNIMSGGALSILYVIQGILKCPLASNVNTRILLVKEGTDEEKRNIAVSLGPGNGLVMFGGSFSKSMVSLCREQKIPYISYAPGNSDWNFIAPDNYNYSLKACSYMIKNSGRKKIAFVSTNHTGEWVEERFRGYHDALKKNKLPFVSDLVINMDDTRFGAEKLETLLKEKKIDAIFTAHYFPVPRMMEIIRMLKMKIPEELSVFVYDDMLELLRNEKISAIRTNFQAIGEKLCAALTGMIENGFRDDIRILADDELVLRGSE